MSVGRSRLLRSLVRLLLVVFLGLVGFAVVVLVVIPKASHGVALTVLTGSMTPDIPIGSAVIDRPVDPGTLKVGDIATYQKAPSVNEYITHRIVAIHTKTNPVTFTFKGDANRGADITPVPATAIRGKVWFHVPYLGAIRDSIQSHGMRAVALLLVILGLGGFALYQFIDAARKRKRRAEETNLRLTFAADAFGDADPLFIAELLQGECEPGDDGTVTMTFTDASRFEVLRDLLARYEPSETDVASKRAIDDSTGTDEAADFTTDKPVPVTTHA